MFYAETGEEQVNLSDPTVRSLLRFIQLEGALHTTRQHTNLPQDVIIYYTDSASEENIESMKGFYKGFLKGSYTDLRVKKKEETKAQISGEGEEKIEGSLEPGTEERYEEEKR